MSNLEDLRKQWSELYAHTLPQLAKIRDPAQSRWPVTPDHCFARIILDNTVGDGQRQWDAVIERPAIKNMTEQQLRKAIALGEQIKAGEVDLCQLDKISLKCREKTAGMFSDVTAGESQVQTGQADQSIGRHKRSLRQVGETKEISNKKAKPEKRQSQLHFGANKDSTNSPFPSTPSSDRELKHQENAEDIKQILHRIRSHPSLTPYRKKLYTALLSVPRGRYTTYAAMSDYLDSSARAVGNGMRNNPFAPDVPCHRVLAANGTIGGFHGDWGRNGKYADKKIELLRSEGVRFDASGKVVGEPFRKFHTFHDIQ
ncbi:uncharacterized protein Z518_09913 [Rhinocladiella mackenziei CBS 650.93]|uniref:Methylated-DNA--protein-cysteine methyltransferase n=1 Tax=Rhinocladiella mackenziei CBS 650.93 TaxID=1442369 RepID=A0A0D2GR99_9EURO|nr:uncharacterized protein Z518_09913 [Rhinocladiella mackenziei CBS 650.93]KIX00848.1 hypothetical protein Z518_09913 [Rhinocladiella mackenziei CBS 650.93]